ncbi:hypothetical protein LCI18_014622 [Fusarium solani-melongenae]|uniref:Uncharacterized protein n=1 Tax=Fusarium solani subsp. cucurbitae TaxID=2747967 RepID=A0ACD3ZRD6_FUSSC|nr:hypothetical protein LCI18_014622 [Fusarium solani-melongenae]
MFQTMRSFPNRFCTFDLNPEQPRQVHLGLNQIAREEENQIRHQEALGSSIAKWDLGAGTAEGSKDEVAFEIQRMKGHLMGTFLPKGTDIVDLYEELGIDTSNDVNRSEGTRVPSMKAHAPPARPHQLMGAN